MSFLITLIEEEEMKELQAWQQRVLDEKENLDNKLRSLSSFLILEGFRKLEDRDQELLERQEALMKELSRVLEERISRF